MLSCISVGYNQVRVMFGEFGHLNPHQIKTENQHETQGCNDVAKLQLNFVPQICSTGISVFQVESSSAMTKSSLLRTQFNGCQEIRDKTLKIIHDYTLNCPSFV